MMLARGVANGERTRNRRVCPVFESSNVTALVAAFEGAMSMTIERMESVLDDGTKVSIRELEPSDPGRSDALLGLLDVTAAPPAFGHVDADGGDNSRPASEGDTTIVVVASREPGDQSPIVGAARCDRHWADPSAASFSVVVVPELRGRRLATLLIRTLAEAAHGRGVRTFHGEIEPDNRAMLALLEDIGLRVGRASDGMVVHASVDLQPTDVYLAAVARDEKAAAQAALSCFLRPERVAVIGASRDRYSIGGLVFANLLAGEFDGVVYPVNRSTGIVQGVAAYERLSECPEVPDLVVVCVPADSLPDVIDEAGQFGVRAACVISAGFAEVGEAGGKAQTELVKRARSHGIRLIGPNCMGLLNASADVRMNATFAQRLPAPGRVSFVSQSGALGLSVLSHLDDLGIGVCNFVSVGNKADISGNDLLLYWEDDPATDVILMYLESFGNPRRFSRIARRISRSKPIIVVKAGRTTAGQRAAQSHTAALAAGERAVDALFRQTGVIRTDTLEEMFAVATVAATQPSPPGRRVAIMTNGGGPGILAADACEARGLSVVALSDRTQAELRGLLPSAAGITNPVDMVASSTAEHYAATLEVLGNAPEVDAVIAIFIPPIITRADDVADALADARSRIPADKPVLAVFMGQKGLIAGLRDANIPSFAFPEDAARALSSVTEWAEWGRRPIGHVVHPDGCDIQGGRQIVDAVLARRGGPGPVWLDVDETESLLDAYKVPLAAHVVVSSPDEAAEAFERLDADQVVVKIASSVHKKDIGGVQLGLCTPDEAAAAVDEIRTQLDSAGLAAHAQQFIVQEMATDGVEVAVGVVHDPAFGPLIAVGCGGSLVELIQDVSLRITPVSDTDVDEMLTSLRTYPLLTGFRGSPPLDIDALKDLLHRINHIVETIPEIAEMDLNPVFVNQRGVTAVDARIAVQQSI